MEGSVTLDIPFTNSKRPILLVVSPLQASILMMFNDHKSCTFSQILYKLFPHVISDNHISHTSATYQEILKQSLLPLITHKYAIIEMIKNQNSSNSANNNNSNRVYLLNSVTLENEDEFEQSSFVLKETINAKKLPRKIIFPALTSEAAMSKIVATFKSRKNLTETQQTLPASQNNNIQNLDHVSLERAREFEIDASIIRIMKTKSPLDWNQLQIRVVEALTDRFLPEPKMIKRRIESLIQREFLKRDEKNFKLFYYDAN